MLAQTEKQKPITRFTIVVVGLRGEHAGAAVVVFLQSERVRREGSAGAGDGTLENAIARGIIDVELLAVGARVPFGQPVGLIVGERAGHAARGPRALVAPGVVASTVDSGGAAFGRAGRAQ